VEEEFNRKIKYQSEIQEELKEGEGDPYLNYNLKGEI
jgi:hypothetical protein